MSVSRHHAEWLSLVESSGPFLSLPVLMRVFPQGLDPRDPEQAKHLRLAYEERQESPNLAGKQRAWFMYVLTHALGHPEEVLLEGQALPPGLSATMAEYGETLRPDLALVGPAGSELVGKPQLLISIYPAEQSLEKPVADKHWKATPGTRMMELLHATDVPLGLVTNGEQWMLVFAPRGDTTGFASWYASLWIDEPITLRAFQSLLSTRRFFGVAASDTLLALLKESAQDQQEVTNQLGDQVRDAVEVMIQAFDRLDQDSGRLLLRGVDEKNLYDAALTVMMRLVFLFSAEERGLLHLGTPMYDDNYAVSTLREQLQEVADRYGEEVLERRHDAWARLLATFRAVHAGVSHQDFMLPAYGGSLFDPDRYPFLEGRAQGTGWHTKPAEPLEINNRVVLHLLKSLQMLQVKVPGGGPAEALRVSFEGLNIEQIGHVYEGLLDHTAVRAKEVVLGLAASRKKPVVAMTLSQLEVLRQQDEAKLIEALEEATDRSAKALEKALKNGGAPEGFHKVLIACAPNQDLAKRVGAFCGLLRQDSFDRPAIVLPGGIYIGQGSTRRSTGTHYTPRSLTEPIVQYTLEPLVYQGPAEGLPKAQWRLKSPQEILDLKVCDMAMGSGAFLVQVCRYLSERLVEAWENLETEHPGELMITPEGAFSQGEPSERLIPKEPAERLAIARRLVADRCIFGVDINPMAVEMAKLSIWLITVDNSRPFTFLDHALKCGDSLLGANSLQQIENFSLRPGERQITFSTANLFRYVDDASTKRKALEAMPSDSPGQIDTKNSLHAEAEAATAKVKALTDCLVAMELHGLKGRAYDEERTLATERAEQAMRLALADFQLYARKQLRSRRTFHWPLEFPEVFERKGFDAFIGNPPFMGGLRLSEVLGDDYNSFLMSTFSAASKKADLCAYFFLRAYELGKPQSAIGLLATNTISQGVTRRTSLDNLIAHGCSIYRSVKSFQWPGQAAVIAAMVHFSTGSWKGSRHCDHKPCEAINSLLDPDDTSLGPPRHLVTNAAKCFQGATMWGNEFFIDESQAKFFLALSPRNAHVVRPAMGGRELNSSPAVAPHRWAINFGELNREEAETYNEVFQYIESQLRDKRSVLDREKYERIVVSWWKYFHSRSDLFDAITRLKLKRVLARSRVSDLNMMAFVESNIIFTDALVVFLFDSYSYFSVLQSTQHDLWVRVYASTLKNDVRYVVSDCFETFPFPEAILTLENIGRTYYEFRRDLLLAHQKGLTETYSRFHDAKEASREYEHLRALHVELDRSVAAAYGWVDLDLGHGFHETKQGVRYTLSASARRVVLDRLLALNHNRYEGEVRAGLHEKKAGSGKRGSRRTQLERTAAQGGLY